ELRCITICETAISCTTDLRLQREWQAEREEARSRAACLRRVCASLSIGADRESIGRCVVRTLARSLQRVMRMARNSGDEYAARVIGAECVVLARLKVRQNWEVIGDLARAMSAADGRPLREAHALVERQQECHLYHTRARRLWGEALG